MLRNQLRSRSLFDALTFLILLFVFRSGHELFRTGWFVESLMTELAVSLVVRTWRPCFSSPPARLWVVSTVLIAAIAVAIPYLPIAHYLGFVPLPAGLVATIIGVAVAYVASAELLKRTFAKRAA